jgi:hypothetical protein
MRISGMALVLVLSGCSVYVSHPPDAPPPPGTEVRVRLTTPGAVRVSRFFGQPVEEIQGRLLSANGDSLGLSLARVTEYGRPWDAADTLMVAREEYFQLDEKRLDGKRTALLVGGVGVVSGIVIGALFRAATRGGEGEPPGDSDLTLIPLFSIRH